MHDPQGRLEFAGDEAIRRCHAPLAAGHFLRSDLASRLVREGSLMEYRLVDEATVSSPRVPFVSYPHEWTDAQLADAGRLTLALSRTIFEEGWELKDASAWNVIFRGTRPVFCDHLSFQRIPGRHWWAFAQFVRHFVLPLGMSRMKVFDARMAFVLDSDGLPPERARDTLGARRFLTRYWPLMLTLQTGGVAKGASGRRYHPRLYALLDWLLSTGAASRPGRGWADYPGARDHYPPEASTTKRATIAKWLERRRPGRVIDLGCNTGEYSLLARHAGAHVVAIDLDHDCVQRLYRGCPDDGGMSPVIANLADLDGGRGWGGVQYPGLGERLSGFADVTMMLALTHHLAISHAIPYGDIAAFVSGLTRGALIVELVEADDPMVALLCAQRRRLASEFTLERQRAAFAGHFRAVDEVGLPGVPRRLVLLERA
jgi:predicted RNA methylase